MPNKFGALNPGKASQETGIGTLYREMEGVGAHEVIIETPEHGARLALMPENQVLDVLRSYKERYQSLATDPRVKLISIFKNHGQSAGTSLEHPHSQVIATPVIPKNIQQKLEVARNYYDDHGRYLYDDIVDEETARKERLVLETDDFVVFNPFASRWPFETWIVPKRQQPAFGEVSDADLKNLALVLKSSLLKIFTVLKNPDYNLILHSAPVEDANKEYDRWHLQIIPRLAKAAGFELGSGMAINSVLPEQAAKYLNEV